MNSIIESEKLIQKAYYSGDYKNFEILCLVYSISKELAEIILHDAISNKEWNVIKILKFFPVEAKDADFKSYDYEDVLHLESVVYDVASDELWFNLLLHMVREKFNLNDIKSFLQNDRDFLFYFYSWLGKRSAVPYELIELLNYVGYDAILSNNQSFFFCVERLLHRFDNSMYIAFEMILKVYGTTSFGNILADLMKKNLNVDAIDFLLTYGCRVPNLNVKGV